MVRRPRQKERRPALCTTEKTHEAEFEKSYSCRFGLRVCRAVFVRLVRVERGFSLSVEKAEARGRQNGGAGYGYGAAGAVGAAAAVGTADAIGATSPYYTGGGWG